MKKTNWVTDRAWRVLKGQVNALTFGLALIYMASMPVPAKGQWTGGPTGPVYYNGGNVGIGTTTPSDKFHVSNGNITVNRNDSFAPIVSIASMNAPGWAPGILDFGRVGTGYSATPSNSAIGTLRFNGLTTGSAFYVGAAIDIVSGANSVNGFPTSMYFTTSNGDSSGPQYRMLIGSNGNIGIGTTSPQYLLSVNGTMGAKDVIVSNTGWSDYVFDPGYRLRPLSEVDSYIQAHRRLPDIPSEAEVKEKGVSVGEMQAKLLAKIEELMLHMIQQEKDNQKLRDRILQLENRVAESGTRVADR